MSSPGHRRILAQTRDGQTIEIDVAPETPASPGEEGVVLIRRGSVFARG